MISNQNNENLMLQNRTLNNEIDKKLSQINSLESEIVISNNKSKSLLDSINNLNNEKLILQNNYKELEADLAAYIKVKQSTFSEHKMKLGRFRDRNGISK